MTPEQAAYLKNCNGFGDYGHIELPCVKRGDDYYTPNGLKVVTPKKWREATPAQIVAEMDADGSQPVIGPDHWGVQCPTSH